MELAPLITLRLPPTILRLARAELAKVLSSLGHYIFEQFDLDSPQLLPCSLISVNIFWVTGRSRPRTETAEKERVGGMRGKDPMWSTGSGCIPPRVTSKKTIGLASVVSAMVVAVQSVRLAAGRVMELYDVRRLRSIGT
jgi:hypothetical protein